MSENGPSGQGANGERRAISGLALKWGHLIIGIIVYLLSIGVMWGTMRAQLDDVREQNKQAVTQAQFKEFKQGVEQRLDKIERTLEEIDRVALKKSIEELAPKKAD